MNSNNRVSCLKCGIKYFTFSQKEIKCPSCSEVLFNNNKKKENLRNTIKENILD